MSEQSDKESRTEEATDKRRRDAREEGQLPRSRDLSAAAVTLAAVALILFARRPLGEGISAIMYGGLARSRAELLADDAMTSGLLRLATQALLVIAPVLIVTALAAFGASLLLGGWNFSSKAFGFKGERLDPLKGIARIFSVNGLVELGKALVKVVVIGAICALLLRNTLPDLLAAANTPVANGIEVAFGTIATAALWLAGALVLIGLVDAPWQLFQSAKNLRMTREEVKKEYKESEGSPEIKQRVRQVQQQMSRARMMAEVPRADVVVMNPTHFAVALRYDDKKMLAPIVVAKGVDHMALQIREVAKANKVTLLSAPPLARALYRNAEVGHAIPTALYVAVAQVLAYVYQLKQAADGSVPMPEVPTPDVDPALSDPPNRH
jgi:flagellar biosynthetic protein FlhB